MNFLLNKWKDAPPQFIVTGVLGPESNAHGPNEFLHIPYVKKLIGALSKIVYDITLSEFQRHAH
jgi:acetylornithine deacetylase/succinyl-diaminopimelate desuccinylase-like protein